MKDFIDGLFNLSKSIVTGAVIIICALLILIGVILGMAIFG